MTDRPDLVLIDGSSYLYRAFHALPPLATKSGQPTGAVKGVVAMVRKLVKDTAPAHVAVVFDARGKTFRHERYEQYKANRPPMPDDLAAQVEPLHAIVQAMGLPLLQIPGVEADDVIGTLATQAAEQGLKVLVSTGDKDLAQLVRPGVTLIDTMKNALMDEAGVKEKFGIPAARIIDWLALVGDTSDNIPGVPGVGPKTAVKWLNEYGSLDELVARADEVKGKAGERLRESLEQLSLSRELATIKCDVALETTVEKLSPGAADEDALRQLYTTLEFKQWLEELDREGIAARRAAPTEKKDEGVSASTTVGATLSSRTAEDANQAEATYQCITDERTLDAWLRRLQSADLFAFDTETTSLDYAVATIVGVSFSIEPGEAAYVPLAHDYPDAPQQLDRDATLAKLRPLLEDADRPKVGQHLKYDANVLANHAITLRGIAHDTMLQSYILDSMQRHDMDSLAGRVLGLETIHYEDVAGKGAKQIGFAEVRVDDATHYAAEDADITLRLHRAQWARLQEEATLRDLYLGIEMPLVPVLARIEQRGVLIDADMLFAQGHELEERMREVEATAHKEGGGQFNLSSPKQLQEILFEKQGLPVKRKTPTGQPSTAEDVLAELADDYELPRLILEYRGLAKLKSTYTDKLPTMINARTGRVHTSYHQAVAATGRLSSSDPNLQNIPIRKAEGRRIRQAFIAPPGMTLIAADYSQIELRIMAHLSEDTGLLEAFAGGEDIHRATAAEVFGVDLDAVSSDQRRSAKAINFGLIYGMSAFGLARQLGIGRGEAAEYVDKYFERYPGVRAFMDRTREQAKQRGYVETVFGRRLYLPDINARNHNIQQYAERTAINAPMQGTAADIIKRAMIDVDAWLQADEPDCHMVMQVHDELVFEAPAGEAERLMDGIRVRMSAAAELAVPLEVEARAGANWDEAH